MRYYMICRFLSNGRLSPKAYAYEIDKETFDGARIGLRYNIKNGAGYDYHNAVVEVTGLVPSDSEFVVGVDREDNSRLMEATTGFYDNGIITHDIKKAYLKRVIGSAANGVVNYFSVLTSIPNIDKPVVVKPMGLKQTFKCAEDAIEAYNRFRRSQTPTPDLDFSINMEEFRAGMAKAVGRDYAEPIRAISNTVPRLSNPRDMQNFLTKTNENNKEQKENRIMTGLNKIFGGFEFGKYTGSDIRMSMNGLAYRNASGKYVAYSEKEGTLTDMSDFMFDFDGLLYLMPVAIKDIAIGDIIRNQRNFVIVTAVNGANLTVIDPLTNEIKTIIPVRNVFGFDFYTKVVNIMGKLPVGNVNADNPFGSMLPMMLLMGNGDNGNGFDMKTLMLMNMMGGNGFKADNNNMLMFALMSKDGGSDLKELLPLMMMTNGNNPFAGLMGGTTTNVTNINTDAE